MNGTSATGVAAIDAVTGATRPFAINQKITNQGDYSAVYSVTTDGPNVYGTGYDFGGPGNLEGSFVAKADGGAIVGSTAAAATRTRATRRTASLYIASHTHDCSSIGGFPEQPVRVHKFASAYTIAPSGVNGATTFANNEHGRPARGQAARLVPHHDPRHLHRPGSGRLERDRQRPVRRLRRRVPAGQRRRTAGPGPLRRPGARAEQGRPVGRSRGHGDLAGRGCRRPINWTAIDDPDNQYLTYSVYRDGAAAPVYETAKALAWWQTLRDERRPTAGVSGSLRYRVAATDPLGNQVDGGVGVRRRRTGAGHDPARYAATVRADGAQSLWRLGEASGTAADDGRHPAA